MVFPMTCEATLWRPDKLGGDDDEVKLVTSRKDLAAARKKNVIEASTRCKTLLGFIREKNWNQLLQKLEYHESDAREWIEEKNDDGSTRWKSLIIHLVCERQPPVEVVSELLRIYPKSVSIKNYGGDLPIHIACREGASKEVVELILNGKDGFDCVKIADCEGRLPLHLAAGNKTTSVKTIQDLINVYEKATRTPDDFHLFPLHWACSKNASPRVVETIIQAYPYAIEAKDAWDRAPLDLAKMSTHPEKAQIVELLSRDVSSWSTAVMSTVVSLSNKLLEADKLEKEFKEQSLTMKIRIENDEKKDRHIDTLKLELKLLEERFIDEIDYMRKKHTNELKAQKEKSDEVIAQLTQEKDEAEKKLADLKILVDEVVAQLKEHQDLVNDKETERKNLKLKAVALLEKMEEQKEETHNALEENKKLKQECIDLRGDLAKRDEHLKQLKSSLTIGYSKDRSTSPGHYQNSEHRQHFFNF